MIFALSDYIYHFIIYFYIVNHRYTRHIAHFFGRDDDGWDRSGRRMSVTRVVSQERQDRSGILFAVIFYRCDLCCVLIINENALYL